MTEPDFLSDTRATYDTMAVDYHQRFGHELAAKPLDRAMLAAFAELVRGPVADIGCGTGRIAAHLTGLGLSVRGIDLSPQMIASARANFPELRFEVGSMLDLDLPDATLGGVLAWYSTIHVPGEELPRAFAEFYRVLAPGGYVLLGFQVGAETLHHDTARGRPISLDVHHRQPDDVAAILAEAGLLTRAKLRRERDEDGEFPERTPQGFVLARKPPA
jgi:ubiquinone/menaquinone biosynthesis C-methylase UbiE